MTLTSQQQKNPWYSRSADGTVTMSAQQFNEIIQLLSQLLTQPLGDPNCPPVRVCGTPVNGYHIQWNSTGAKAEWAPSASTFLGLTDTPSSYAGHLLKVVRVNALGTGLEFHTLTLGATNFLGLTDTPASYAGSATYFVRVNAGGTGLEFVAGASGDFVGPASAIDGSVVLFDGSTGKLGKQGPELSLGGNGAADSGKIPTFNTEGQLRCSVVGSSTPAIWAHSLGSGAAAFFQASTPGYTVNILQGGTGSGIDISFAAGGTGINIYAAGATGIPLRTYRLSGTDDLARFHGNMSGTLGINVLYHGGLTWLDVTGRDHTRTQLGLDTAAYQPTSAFEPAGAALTAENNAKAYADGLVVGLFDDRGNYDASTNLYPTTGGSGVAGAVLKGDVWRISVAGTLGGEAIDVGDTIRALVDTPGQTASNWAKFEANTQQATETVRGTLAVATQAEIEDESSTNDIDAVTPTKWWRGFYKGLSISSFFSAVHTTVLTGLSVAVGGAITASDSILTAFGKLQNQITGLGTSKQDADADLTAIAGLSPSDDDVIQRKAGSWINRTLAQLAADLGLAAGAYNKFTTIRITSTTGSITTSWTNINGTSVAVTAGTQYTIQFVVVGRITSTSGGINVSCTGPAAPTHLSMRIAGTQSGGQYVRPDIDTYDSMGSLAELNTAISSTKYTIFQGIVEFEPSVNGTFQLRAKRGGSAGTIDFLDRGYLSIMTS